VLLLEAHADHSSPLVSLFTIIVAPSNLFPTFILSSSTPKMDRIRSVVTSRGSMTYTGPLNLLDSQDSFDLIFGSNPTMLRLTSGKNRQCASDTVYLATELHEFCNFCQLHIFCDSVQLQYVGTETYDSQKMLADICLALSSLKMISTHKGKLVFLTLDDLYSRYIEFLPLLASNTMTWSFSLVTFFSMRFPLSCKKLCSQGGMFYLTFPLYSLFIYRNRSYSVCGKNQ